LNSAAPPLLQAIASATSSGKGQAIASVLAEAISNGGTAQATGAAIAEVYGKDKGGVTLALADALSIANSDGAKTGVAASSVAEVRAVPVFHIEWECTEAWIWGASDWVERMVLCVAGPMHIMPCIRLPNAQLLVMQVHACASCHDGSTIITRLCAA
jgi:hypothetical protein